VTSTHNFVGRSVMVLIPIALSMVVLVVQLIRVQFGPIAPVFASQDESSSGLIEKKFADRGLIFDRDGKLLATNNSRYFLDIDTKQLTDESVKNISLVVAELLNLSKSDLEVQLNQGLNNEKVYWIRLTQPISKGVDIPIRMEKVAADIIKKLSEGEDKLDLNGLTLVPTQERIYPAGELLAHVLGFVNQEGLGYFGVEGYYDDWLTGKSATIEKVYIPLEVGSQPDPIAGANLVLTIDLDIQQTAATALQNAIERTQAEGGQVIIMDPKNGEILAMVALPALDPEKYEEWLVGEHDENLVISPAVAGQYEPGSTFKALVLSAAINEGVVSPEDEFIDTGEIEIGGRIIRNWDGKAWGLQTIQGCVQYSLNTCFAYIVYHKLQAVRFYSAMKDFGIGSLTGIDMAGEISGQMRTPGDPEWTESDLGTNSFGQGLSVTPIQLVTAVSAIANGGVMVLPHVVREIVSPQGEYWPNVTMLGRPIIADTAQVVTNMLHQALVAESSLSLVDGYQLAGKTGTAQIATDYGYDPNKTIASFIGWGPLRDPKFVVYVRIDKPQNSPWGSVVAAPVFSEIVERLVIELGIPPDDFILETAGRVEAE